MKINSINIVLMFLIITFSSAYAFDLSAEQKVAVSDDESMDAYHLEHSAIKGDRFDLSSKDRGYLDWSNPAINPRFSDDNRPLVYDVSAFMRKTNATHAGFDLDIPLGLGELAQAGAAFLANLVIHELGHAVVADYAGASGNRLDFFKKEGDQFFFGTSTVENIDEESRLSYTMGGEFFADITFEHALRDYRKNPTMFNKSLLIASGTDFLWYCMYAFYLSDGHPHFDPVSIAKETGLSKDEIFSVALAKTMLNAYRVYSGEDRIVPYFTVDKYSAMLNVAVPFEIDNFIAMVQRIPRTDIN